MFALRTPIHHNTFTTLQLEAQIQSVKLQPFVANLLLQPRYDSQPPQNMKLFTTLLLATAATAAPTLNSNFPRASSCMNKSIKVAGFVVKDFRFKSIVAETANGKSYDSKVTFTLENEALDSTATCKGKSHSKNFFDGRLTYECNSSDGMVDKSLFTYNRKSGKITIAQSWDCPQDGATFSAGGDATFNLACEETDVLYKKITKCTPKTISVPVTLLSAGA